MIKKFQDFVESVKYSLSKNKKMCYIYTVVPFVQKMHNEVIIYKALSKQVKVRFRIGTNYA